MLIIQPNTTGSQLLKLKVRETSSLGPITCSISYGSSDRWTYGNTTCSVAEFDSNDFLNLSTSIDIPYDEVYSFQIYQVSSSNLQYKELFRGELMATTESVTVRKSEPFVSYTGSSTNYIIF
jgi:hypothetical protein